MAKKSGLLIVIMLLLAASFNLAQAQDNTLRVEAAVTGELSTAQPSITYTFFAVESLRMAVVFDVVSGDMQPTVTVLGSDQTTVLAGSMGTNNNGVIVEFPSAGQYYITVAATGGTSASYRLMLDADPALPTNAFVLQSYLVAGASTVCAENVPTASFTTSEDLNICFITALVEQPTTVTIQWWSPSGDLVIEESGNLDSTTNFQPYLSGLVFQQGQPFEAGWWQAHILLNGELSHIQWVPVQ